MIRPRKLAACAPSPGNEGEAIIDGYVEAPRDDVDEGHLGN